MPKKTIDTETVPISTRVTPRMAKAINDIVAHDRYISASDYLRDLIRKDLNERGAKPILPHSTDQEIESNG